MKLEIKLKVTAEEVANLEVVDRKLHTTGALMQFISQVLSVEMYRV